MKINWINVIATILIVSGIFLLVRRATAPVRTAEVKHSPTTQVNFDAAKAQVRHTIELALHRPLDPAEQEMMVVERQGNAVTVRLLEPLQTEYFAATKGQATQPTDGTAVGGPMLPLLTPAVGSSTPTMQSGISPLTAPTTVP